MDIGVKEICTVAVFVLLVVAFWPKGKGKGGGSTGQ